MKFISSNYDSETGLSTVVMQHMGEKYTGTAQLHSDEKDKGSNYAGCYYAEMRAVIKALKEERKLAKIKADAAIDFVKSVEGYKNFDKESPTAKAMYRQLNRRIKKVNDLADEINYCIKELKGSIIKRSLVAEKLEGKKTKEIN